MRESAAGSSDRRHGDRNHTRAGGGSAGATLTRAARRRGFHPGGRRPGAGAGELIPPRAVAHQARRTPGRPMVRTDGATGRPARFRRPGPPGDRGPRDSGGGRRRATFRPASGRVGRPASPHAPAAPGGRATLRVRAESPSADPRQPGGRPAPVGAAGRVGQRPNPHGDRHPRSRPPLPGVPGRGPRGLGDDGAYHHAIHRAGCANTIPLLRFGAP